jgi:hypothetical protein
MDEELVKRVGLALEEAWNAGDPEGQDLPPIELTPAERAYLTRAILPLVGEFCAGLAEDLPHPTDFNGAAYSGWLYGRRAAIDTIRATTT